MSLTWCKCPDDHKGPHLKECPEFKEIVMDDNHALIALEFTFELLKKHYPEMKSILGSDFIIAMALIEKALREEKRKTT